jgi:hypothetical protein
VIEVHVYLSSKHEALACTVKVGEQLGKTGVVIQNIAGEKGTLGGPVEGISAEKEGLCGKESTTTAKEDIDVTVEGRNEKGEVTGISITHP